MMSAQQIIHLDNQPVAQPTTQPIAGRSRILEVVPPRRQHGLNKTFRHIGKSKLWVITAARESPCSVCESGIKQGQTITLYTLGWGHVSHLPQNAEPKLT